ncbi:MAG: winged helix-turn-helix transcriptional regulator [Prevotella sp.]|nr:winged helix-turn-helix transcriptional regulator [Prevotella sp.]
MVKEDPYISTSNMAHIIGIDRRNIARNIKKLQEQGKLRRVGPDKGGFWEIII